MPTVNPGQAKELRGKIDYASILGVLLAMASLVGGFLLEGGRLAEVAQLTAVLIVFGGTLGAVLLNTPIDLLLRTVRRLPEVFFHSPEQFGEMTDQIARLALKSRREGLISLEDDLGRIWKTPSCAARSPWPSTAPAYRSTGPNWKSISKWKNAGPTPKRTSWNRPVATRLPLASSAPCLA